MADADSSRRIGQRVVVVGSSCSGKSTVAARLAGLVGVPFVELDALFWKPNWVGSEDDEFREKIVEATAGDGWIVAGSYSRHAEPTIWPRAEAIVWLDFPLRTSLWRIVKRSWRRSRSNELLWGTNHEKFWPQLKLWDDESLLTFTWKNHRLKRDRYRSMMADPSWSHLRWVPLRNQAELDAWLREVEAEIVAPMGGEIPAAVR